MPNQVPSRYQLVILYLVMSFVVEIWWVSKAGLVKVKEKHIPHPLRAVPSTARIGGLCVYIWREDIEAITIEPYLM